MQVYVLLNDELRVQYVQATANDSLRDVCVSVCACAQSESRVSQSFSSTSSQEQRVTGLTPMTDPTPARQEQGHTFTSSWNKVWMFLLHHFVLLNS